MGFLLHCELLSEVLVRTLRPLPLLREDLLDPDRVVGTLRGRLGVVLGGLVDQKVGGLPFGVQADATGALRKDFAFSPDSRINLRRFHLFREEASA